MTTPAYDTLVLGSGPAGLSAGDRLVRAARRVLILETASLPGGLMRSVRHGDYSVDIGRKELYTRLPEVVELWSEVLGDDYIEYPHRLGVLYEKSIVERSRAHRGILRGIPPRILAVGALDLLARRVRRLFGNAPANEEEYWYGAKGKVFSRVLSQGHAEKFGGERWRDKPVPVTEVAKRVSGVTGVVRRATVRDFGLARWMHPALGTGQIIDALHDRYVGNGGEIVYGVDYTSLRSEGDEHLLEYKDRDGDTHTVKATSVVSTLRLPRLAALLAIDPPETPAVEAAKRRSTLIVYLFIDEPPQFEHAWLDVTDPATPIGRVTSYANFNGRMVPPGRTCLAAEIFLVGPDPLLDSSDDELTKLVVRDLGERAGLFTPSRLESVEIMRFPGAFAADDYRSWLEPGVRRFLDELRKFAWLYDTHRAGTDVATFAGLMAAEAILRGDRAEFDERADPANPLGIESTRLFG